MDSYIFDRKTVALNLASKLTKVGIKSEALQYKRKNSLMLQGF
jgi:hypothetical protein